VSVYRDNTAQVKAEEHGRVVVQQISDAYILAIEASDPYLGGQSRIMTELAGMIANSMGLKEPEKQTIEQAAKLSQIGKAFVPREILNKPGRLTDDERKTMESHVEHTKNLIARIDFAPLPVVDAVYQMNEYLDGSGYPQKLTGDQIGKPAKVLAVANQFTSMVRPRSFRPAKPVEEAISIIEQGVHTKYDAGVVQALLAVLQTPEGEMLIQRAATSKTEKSV
jgi:HD-GYP domain-containing protein (c-di-GMP phosphodiesterase class II)